MPADEESVLVARIHAGLALFGAAWSRLDVAEDSCRRGLAIARKVGARREEGLLVNASGLVEAAHGDIESGARLLRQSLAIAAEVGNPDDLATAYINLSHVLGLGGRVDEIVEVAREGADVLTRMGLARQRVSFLKANLAETLGNAGRIAESGRVIAEALSQHPRGIMSVPVLMQAGRVAMVRGDLDEAWEWLEQARVIVESENAPESYRRYLVETEAEVELWAGRPVAAYDLVIEGLDLVRGTDEAAYAGTLVALGLRALATEAEAHRDRESRKRLGRSCGNRSTRPRVARGQPAGGRRRARVGAGRDDPAGPRPATPPPGARPGRPGGLWAGRSPGRTRGGGRRRLGSTPESTRPPSTPCATRIPRRWGWAPRGSCRSASGWRAGTASTSSRNRSRPSRTPSTSTA